MSAIIPEIRSRIEELRSRITEGGIFKGGLFGQGGIAAGGGVGARGIKVFGQEGEKRPLEEVIERVRERIDEFREQWKLPAPIIRKPGEEKPPSETPTSTAGTPVKTYSAKIKTY